MGVVNRSADSFYSSSAGLSEAVDTAAEMVAAGVDILDIGGEATNPQVDIRNGPNLQKELDLVVPTIDAFKQRFDVLLSVDSSKPAVMQASIQAGADIINDQHALEAEGALQVVAESDVSVCLMHFPVGRQPGSGSAEELLQTIRADLMKVVGQCRSHGIADERIILDPGFGQGHFAKNLEENCYLMAHLDKLVDLGFPVLVGWSRKSMIGEILGGLQASQRLIGSVAAALYAVEKGASIIRVHDVNETVQAIKVCQTIKGFENV